jgi:alpha-ketoglutarate-dependent taurine dioxygenase
LPLRAVLAAINVNRFFATVPGYPMIAGCAKEPERQRNIYNDWHTDHSYDEAPALGSMLCAREVPKTGGDTLFASMYAAYDALSDGLKSTLEGLKALRSSRRVSGPAAAASREHIGAVSLRGEPRATKPSDRKSTQQPAIALLHSQRQRRWRLNLTETHASSWRSRRLSP